MLRNWGRITIVQASKRKDGLHVGKHKLCQSTSISRDVRKSILQLETWFDLQFLAAHKECVHLGHFAWDGAFRWSFAMQRWPLDYQHLKYKSGHLKSCKDLRILPRHSPEVICVESRDPSMSQTPQWSNPLSRGWLSDWPALAADWRNAVDWGQVQR